MRLSFRLDADSARTWEKLKKKHKGRTNTYILYEMLRQEDFRLQGNTKDDRLNELKALLLEIKDILREYIDDQT